MGTALLIFHVTVAKQPSCRGWPNQIWWILNQGDSLATICHQELHRRWFTHVTKWHVCRSRFIKSYLWYGTQNLIRILIEFHGSGRWWGMIISLRNTYRRVRTKSFSKAISAMMILMKRKFEKLSSVMIFNWNTKVEKCTRPWSWIANLLLCTQKQMLENCYVVATILKSILTSRRWYKFLLFLFALSVKERRLAGSMLEANSKSHQLHWISTEWIYSQWLSPVVGRGLKLGWHFHTSKRRL